jgi:hypothetical protein
MAYSYVEYTGSGTTGPFSYASISLLDADTEAVSTQLNIYKNGVLLTFTTDYTINTGAETVTTVSTILTTDLLRIARDTKKDARYVDYVDSTNVTAELLDLDSNQNFFIVQEAIDLQTDAMVRGTDGNWAARGYKIKNMGSGLDGSDAVTLNQLQAAIVGALPATLSGLGYAEYTGDSATVNFAIPAAISTITDPSDVEVFVNGLRQRPTVHYTIVAPNVVFSTAPTTGDNILFAWPEGVISGLIAANAVLTSSIQDDAVTVAKILQGSNGQVLATASSTTAWTNLDSTYISDFDTKVRTSRLDQMAAPTAAVAVGGQKITGLGTPTTGTDAATKAYVDLQPGLTSKTASAVGTGSVTTVSCSFSGVGFTIGGWTIVVPFTQSAATNYFTVSGLCMSGFTTNPSNPIRVLIPDTDTNVGTYFIVTFSRTGAGNDAITFTISWVDDQGVAATMELVTGGTIFASFTKGSS